MTTCAQQPTAVLRRRQALACLALAPWATSARTPPTSANAPAVLRVGPGHTLRTPAAAAAVATDGALVEIEAGNYPGDAAVWLQNRLTLRAVGGRVGLPAAGRAAEGKATWVLRGGQFDIEGIDFSGSRVAARNGAGIRLERGQARVRNCSFIDNENGILTSNFPDVELDVLNCEFGHNGHGDGQSHNLYAGSIGRLRVEGSWFHHAREGHLIKSRAAYTEVRYSLLADGDGGITSYELEFPSGGVAVAVGNFIEQAASTRNPHLVSYGVEGYGWPTNRLTLTHNTLFDRRNRGGIFLRVAPGQVEVLCANNLLLGGGVAGPWLGDETRGNYRITAGDLEQGAQGTPRLRQRAHPRGRAVKLPVGQTPTHQYRHTAQSVALARSPRDPGAFQAERG